MYTKHLVDLSILILAFLESAKRGGHSCRGDFSTRTYVDKLSPALLFSKAKRSSKWVYR